MVRLTNSGEQHDDALKILLVGAVAHDEGGRSLSDQARHVGHHSHLQHETFSCSGEPEPALHQLLWILT